MSVNPSELEAAAREVVERQDAFLKAPNGAPVLFRSHMLSLAIERLRKVLDG